MKIRARPRARRFIAPAISIILSFFLAASCASFPRAGVNRIRKIDLYPENLPTELNGYRIAFVSDTHYGNNFSRARLERLFSAVNAAGADCVILGGDYTLARVQLKEFGELAGGLSAPEGVYAVSGNHDFYNGQKYMVGTLRNEGIVVLGETLVTTPRGLTVAGINDFRDVYPNLAHFREILDNAAFTVLVSHNPDFAEETDISEFDLMLSGHTHGGQITFFGYAPVLPSAYGQKYRTGTIYKDGTPVIVSNGAGYSGVGIQRIRVCAPSDFLLITLRAPAPTKDR